MVRAVESIEELPRVKAWRERGQVVSLERAKVDVFYIASEGFGGSPSGGKPKLVLAHGYPTASFDYHRILPTLEENFEILCWDYAGYGLSQKVYKTIFEQVDIFQELLEREFKYTLDNAVQTHLLSHDYGDSVAQEILARLVEKRQGLNYNILSLVALNGGILPGVHKPRLIQRALLWPVVGDAIAMLMNIRLASRSISKVFGPETQPSDQELQEFYFLMITNGGSKLVNKNIRYMEERVRHKSRWVGALDEYSKSKGFLLIDGPRDPISGRHLAEAVEKTITGSKVELLGDEIGHWPQLEAPEQLLQKFFKFHHETLHTFSQPPKIGNIPER